MAKLNGYRIVNLTYNVKDDRNTSTNRIIDQYFELDGLQSLMLLQNGGGKSVQIQMLIAPFVSPKHRNFGTRPFTDYFKDDKTPTYIATEWVLDNGEKVLIGLMVRKCKPNEVTDDNKGLDIYSYVYPYKDKFDEYSIGKIPFSQYTEDGYIIASTHETLDLFASIKRRNKFDIDYFNLNSQDGRSKYYNKLKTYDIERSEWETIMKTINSSEGGLTELFKNCPDERKLIEDWFLKIIDEKINRDLNTLDEMKNSFKNYFDDKKRKQYAIDIVDGIPEYTQYANRILEVNNHHKNALIEMENNKISIEDLFTYNHQTLKKQHADQTKNMELEQSLEKELAMIKYKEASYNYYIAKEKLDDSIKEEEKQKNIIDELTKESKRLEKEANLWELIQQNCDIQEKEKELEKEQIKKEKENKSNEQIRVQLENVAYSLRAKLDEEGNNIQDILDELESERSDLQDELNDINQEIGSINANNNKLMEEKTKTTDIIKKLTPKVDELKGKYNAPLFIDNRYFEQLIEDNQQEISNTELSEVAAKETLEKLQEDINSLKENLSTLEKRKIEYSMDLNNNKEKLKEIQLKCDKIESILSFLQMPENDIFETDKTIKELNSRLAVVSSKIDKDRDLRNKKQLEIEQLKKGVVVEIPKEVTKLLKELDIEYQLGLSYLSKLKISTEQRDELLENNPFLPFSIVLNSDDIETLKNSKVELTGSYTVYLANKDKISTPIEYSFSNTIREIGNLNILCNFNKALLDETEKNRMITTLNNDINDLNNFIKSNEEHKNSLENKRYTVENFKITKAILNGAINTINNLEDKIIKLDESILDTENKKSNLEKDLVPTQKELLKELDKKIIRLNKVQEELMKFQTDYLALVNHQEDIERIHNTLESNEQAREKYNRRISEISQIQLTLDKRVISTKEKLKEIDDVINEIKSFKFKFENPTVINEEKHILIAQYNGLKEDTTKNIKEIQERINKLDSEIRKAKETIDALSKEYSIEHNEYYGKEFSLESKILNTKTKKNIDKDIEEQRDILRKIDSEKGSNEAIVNSSYKDVLKENDNVRRIYAKYNSYIDIGDFAIDKLLLTDTNFRQMKQDNKELKKAVIEDKKDIKAKIDSIDTSLKKLSFLSDIHKSIENIDNREISIHIDLENLDSITDNEIKKYKQLLNEIDKIRKQLDSIFTELSTNFKHRNINPYEANIKSLLEVKHDPETVETAIQTTLELLEKRRAKYENDLQLLDKERCSTVNMVLKYAENVHKHMDSIDTNSSITLNDSRVKMLEINQPSWDINEATIKVEGFIDKLMDGYNIIYDQGENSNQTPDDFIASKVTTSNLYNEIIGINNIKITIRKLEFAGNEINTSPISWKTAQKNSGGEGFATYFVVLISLLSYMRKESSLVGDRSKESSKVLIMDNPFGKMSSEHLLKPMMEIAKKYNTQLVCFTALKGDNIYNEFDNIYHLNLERIRSAKTNILTADRELKVNLDKDVQLQSSQLRIKALY